jgi:hypothetical protein
MNDQYRKLSLCARPTSRDETWSSPHTWGERAFHCERAMISRAHHGTLVIQKETTDLLVGQFGGNLAGCPVPIVGDVDLDDLLFVVRA